MKTKQETELVEVTYWTCCVDAHRHQTEQVAEACIAKHEKPKELRRRWTRAMMADAVDAALGGATYSEVGRSFGITGGRVQNVIRKAIRMMVHPSRLNEPLPPHDYYSIAEVRQQSAFWKRQTSKFRGT